MLSKILKNMTSGTLMRKKKHTGSKLTKLLLNVIKNPIFHVCNLGKDPLEDRHHVDANPDPDLDRHQHGNSDPDRHQNDADPLHCVAKSCFPRLRP
jgi:hypothetical protein